MEEKSCPICDKAIRSDASVQEFCKLCGMGISDPSDKPKYRAGDGRTVFFCCEKCLTVYNANINRMEV